MIVAGIQLAVSMESKQANVDKATHWVRQAAEQGARLICLQEFFATGSFTREVNPDYFAMAETVRGETIRHMAGLARELQVWLITPLFEEDEQVKGLYYNSAIVLDPTGAVAGRYRKQHIPLSKAGREKYYFTPGDLGCPLFTADSISFGLCICYDRHFFEIPRILALKGADLIFVTNATYRQRQGIWQAELVTMAAQNMTYVVAVNSTGQGDGRDQFGHSLAIDPNGETLSALGEEEGLVLAEVDPEQVREARIHHSLFRDLRPDLAEEMLRLLVQRGRRFKLHAE